jgi:uncharacterized membrane protein YhfC
MKRLSGLLLLALAGVLLSACAAQPAAPASNIDQGSYLTGWQIDSAQAGTADSGFVLDIQKDGQPVGVLLRGNTIRGKLYLRISDSSGAVVWRSDPVGGSFKIDTTITTLKAGKHNLGVGWDGPVGGVYDLYTVPGGPVQLPGVTPVALVSGVGMILVALGFAIYAAVHRLGWGYMGIGALGWVIAVALKFLWAVPVNTPVYQFLQGALPAGWSETTFEIYVGLLTGIFEVIPVWLVVRYTRLGRVNFPRALAFGIGFGVCEAALLGISSLGPALAGILSPNVLPVATLDQLARANDLLYSLAPVSERFFIILVHVFANVLVFFAAAARKPGYFWLAFAYKSLIDAAVAFPQVTGAFSLGQIWGAEGVIAVWGVIGWVGTRWLEAHYPAAATIEAG